MNRALLLLLLALSSPAHAADVTFLMKTGPEETWLQVIAHRPDIMALQIAVENPAGDDTLLALTAQALPPGWADLFQDNGWRIGGFVCQAARRWHSDSFPANLDETQCWPVGYTGAAMEWNRPRLGVGIKSCVLVGLITGTVDVEYANYTPTCDTSTDVPILAVPRCWGAVKELYR